MIDFKLPDVGEGLTEAEVIAWHVAAGDLVDVNDILVEIETAKSVVELPAPAAGVVAAVHVEVGTTIEVGTVLLSIEEAGEPPTEEKPLVLVGTGPTAPQERRRRLSRPVRHEDPGAPSPSPADTTASAGRVEARPPTRADARETRTPIKGVRRATAAATVESAFTAPHVTEWLAVDATRTMDLVHGLRADPAWSGVRITPLVMVARAFLLAIRTHPSINARWDEAAREIVVPHYVNLGIAAATSRGLVVPNIKDAHEMDLRTLAQELERLVETARAGRTQPVDLARGTITITNIGALGVDAGTPILNPGESAILAFGAVRKVPWVHEGDVVPRKVAHLAMSFDHRLVDGELGSRVLAEVGRLLNDPAEAFLR